MDGQLLIPSNEFIAFPGWGCSLICGYHITTDGISIQLQTIIIQEDYDWGSDDLKVCRNFRASMLIILTATREDEFTRTIYTVNPIVGCIQIIIQRHDTHLDVVQARTAVEHRGITFCSKTGSWQLRSLFQTCTIREHIRITARLHANSRQLRSDNQIRALREHSRIAIPSQLRSWQYRSLL